MLHYFLGGKYAMYEGARRIAGFKNDDVRVI